MLHRRKTWMPATSAGMTWGDIRVLVEQPPTCCEIRIRVDATDAESCVVASAEAAPDATRRDHGASSQQAHRRDDRARAEATARHLCCDRAHRREHPGTERIDLCG